MDCTGSLGHQQCRTTVYGIFVVNRRTPVSRDACYTVTTELVRTIGWLGRRTSFGSLRYISRVGCILCFSHRVSSGESLWPSAKLSHRPTNAPSTAFLLCPTVSDKRANWIASQLLKLTSYGSIFTKGTVTSFILSEIQIDSLVYFPPMLSNETAPGGRPGSAPPTAETPGFRPAFPVIKKAATPKSLGEALRDARVSIDTPRAGSETPSEEDYDENIRPALTQPGLRHRGKRAGTENRRAAVVRSDSGVHIIPDDDKGIQEFLRSSSLRSEKPPSSRTESPGKFRDLVFTHRFSAFDRNNAESANSPFHGFYTLFWMGVALFVFKISAENWRTYGTPLGSNDIMKTMFGRDGRMHMIKVSPSSTILTTL